jgi:hypothetical protein
LPNARENLCNNANDSSTLPDSKMKLARLKQLKQKLLQEKDLSKIWLFYMDEFADHPEFIEVGSPKSDSFLEAVIPQICKQMFGTQVNIADLLLIYIPEYQFFHAPFVAGGRTGGLIYFEEERIGLLAVATGFPMSDEVKYSRFSSAPKPKPPKFYELN